MWWPSKICYLWSFTRPRKSLPYPENIFRFTIWLRIMKFTIQVHWLGGTTKINLEYAYQASDYSMPCKAQITGHLKQIGIFWKYLSTLRRTSESQHRQMIASASLHFYPGLETTTLWLVILQWTSTIFPFFLYLFSALVETFINVKQFKLEELEFIMRMIVRNHTVNKDQCDFPLSLLFRCQALLGRQENKGKFLPKFFSYSYP